MFENLSDKLQDIIKKTSGNDKLTEDNMNDALREIRRALLEADVSLTVVKSFISAIRDRAEGEAVLQSVSPQQQLVKIVHDELTKLLGSENSALNLDGHPNIIMMLGLQGSGKTTSSAKLAVKLKKEGRNPLLVACDIYRPAAVSQLKTLGEQTHTAVFSIDNCNDINQIASEAINYAKENGYNTLILDTAGRLQIDTEMMAELMILDKLFAPQEKLLVIDAMTGQEAVNVAANFNEQLNITGLVLTKLDGDARGGAALSIVHFVKKPIKLTGTGEKLNALENFYPERMATRILGMGDIVSLVERAKEVFDEKETLELQKKMKKAEFTFDDFLKMQKQMKMFGGIGNLLSMLPNLGIKKDDQDMISHVGEQQLKKIETLISSMTSEERANPALINPSRKNRIARGSGIELKEVNLFINQFEQMRKMMKGMSSLQDKFKKGKMKIPKGMGGLGNGFPFK